MTDDIIMLLENFIFQSKSQNYEKFSVSSDEYKYYYLLSLNSNLNESYNQIPFDSQSKFFKKFKLRQLFAKYDELKKEENLNLREIQQKQILNDINNLLFQLDLKFPQSNTNNQNLESNDLNQNTLTLKKNDEELFQRSNYSEDDVLNTEIAYYHQFSLEKLALSDENVQCKFLQNIGIQISNFDSKNFFLQNLIGKNQYLQTFQKENFQFLSKSQMKSLLEICPNIIENKLFIEELFIKATKLELKTLFIQDFQQSMINSILSKLYKFDNQLQKFQNSTSTLKIAIQALLLQLGANIRIYDFKLFQNFLSLLSKDQHDWDFIKSDLGALADYLRVESYLNENEIQLLIKNYLIQYFEQHRSFEDFANNFDENYLKNIQIQYFFDSVDQSIPFDEQILDQCKTNEKHLKFCSHNNRTFLPHQIVTLTLELKNISCLTIKVFKINTIDYYKHNKLEFDEKIDLVGQIPLEKLSFTYNFNPFQIQYKSYSFNSINKEERGLFIIDFEDNEIYSRVLIRKGYLQYREEISILGHIFFILDEDSNICTGDTTGIFLDNNYYTSNSKGEIAIPFINEEKSFPAVFIHQNFSFLKVLTIFKAKYSLECAFLIGQEQLILENDSNIVLLPKLYLNETAISLNQVQTLEVIIDKYLQNGMQKKEIHSSLSLDQNFINVPIFLDANLTYFTIVLKVKISDQILEKTHSIDFFSCGGRNNYKEQFLQYNQKNGYQIFVSGKNGEPIKEASLQVKVKLRQTIQYFEQLLYTNQSGYVVLGGQEDVEEIQSTLANTGGYESQKTWKINNLNKFLYPEYIEARQNEKIIFPVFQYQVGNIQLLKIFESSPQSFSVIKNCTNCLKFEQDNVHICIASKGKYRLVILNENIYIQVRILINDVFDSQKNPQGLNFIHSVINNKTGANFTGTIEASGQTTVFALASTFINENFKNINMIFQRKQPKYQLNNKISNKNSTFISNTKIAEEQQYVKQRRENPDFNVIGNNLAKPAILLQRQLLQETEDIQIKLQEHEKNEIQQLIEEDKQKEEAKQEQNDIENSNTTIYTIQNFLQFSAKLFVSKDKQFQFQIQNCYSLVQILILTESSYLIKTIFLNQGNIVKKDLRSLSNQISNYSYIERRQTTLYPDESMQFDKIETAQLKIFDSQKQIFQQLMLIQQNNGLQTNLEQWQFITEWGNYQNEKKVKYYNQFMCNEFNLYLYYKDPIFFEIYVKEFITNKIKKEFIDQFLLENHEALIHYKNVPYFQELNPLEKLLLLFYLNRFDQYKSDGNSIAEYFKNTFLSYKQTQNELSKQFEIVLNSDLGLKNKELAYYLSFRANVEEQRLGGARTRQTARKSTVNPQNEESVGNFQHLIEKDNLIHQEVQRFQNIHDTKMYKEKSYSIDLIAENTRIKFNQFFLDITDQLCAGKQLKDLISSNFYFCTRNVIESLMPFIFMNLPSQGQQHKFELNEKGILITAKSPMIILFKTIKSCNFNFNNELILKQQFFDPYTYKIYKESEILAENQMLEFTTNTVYGCYVNMINCSMEKLNLQLYIQIPEGAIPVNTNFYLKQHYLEFFPLHSERQEFYFYFPAVGIFQINSSYLIQDNEVVAIAERRKAKVIERKLKYNSENFKQVLQWGTNNEILNYLKSKNIFSSKEFNPIDLFFKFGNKEFYKQVMQIYRARKFTHLPSLSYSLHHNDEESLIEFFNHSYIKGILNTNFYYFECSLFKLENRQDVEFYPIINKRVHNFGSQKNNILNAQFKQQYIEFLQYFLEKQNQSSEDYLILIHYILIQDRFEDAIQIYNKVMTKELQFENKIQFNYLEAYLDIHLGYPNFLKARAISQKYLNYHILEWRNKFYEIINLLSEFDDDKGSIDNSFGNYTNQLLSSKDEQLSMKIEGELIKIQTKNLNEVRISFHFIDIEEYCSKYPFSKITSQQFALAFPIFQTVIKIEQPNNQYSFETYQIPKEYLINNMLIKVTGINKGDSIIFQPNSFILNMMSENSIVQVLNKTFHKQAKVYIKVYVKYSNNEYQFFDGYTDIVGRFQIPIKNVIKLSEITKNTVLLVSKDLGSQIFYIQN